MSHGVSSGGEMIQEDLHRTLLRAVVNETLSPGTDGLSQSVRLTRRRHFDCASTRAAVTASVFPTLALMSRRTKSRGVFPTLCFWLIHKRSLALGTRPCGHTAIRPSSSLSCWRPGAFSPPARWQQWRDGLHPASSLSDHLHVFSSLCPPPPLHPHPPHLKFKRFHREIIAELERKTDMDVKYMTVSVFFCLSFIVTAALWPFLHGNPPACHVKLPFVFSLSAVFFFGSFCLIFHLGKSWNTLCLHFDMCQHW